MIVATPLVMKKSPVPPITEMSLVLFIKGSAPAKLMLPLWAVELKTNENPSHAGASASYCLTLWDHQTQPHFQNGSDSLKLCDYPMQVHPQWRKLHSWSFCRCI
uniref:Uncharacterized protein n=1 Tax=Helianthus annuus TaxID=4232 RepID=A0A251RKV3_HELAN